MLCWLHVFHLSTTLIPLSLRLPKVCVLTAESLLAQYGSKQQRRTL